MAIKPGNYLSYEEAIMLFLRYFFLLAIALVLSYSSFFYEVLLKITIYPVGFILNFFYPTFIVGNIILINLRIIELIPACIGLSAYFLFLMLCFMTPMNYKKRISIVLFLFIGFLLINIIRIIISSLLLASNSSFFDIFHKSFWYFMNVIIVLGLWFSVVGLFKISNIPIYMDFKSIIDSLKNRRINS